MVFSPNHRSCVPERLRSIEHRYNPPHGRLAKSHEALNPSAIFNARKQLELRKPLWWSVLSRRRLLAGNPFLAHGRQAANVAEKYRLLWAGFIIQLPVVGSAALAHGCWLLARHALQLVVVGSRVTREQSWILLLVVGVTTAEIAARAGDVWDLLLLRGSWLNCLGLQKPYVGSRLLV